MRPTHYDRKNEKRIFFYGIYPAPCLSLELPELVEMVCTSYDTMLIYDPEANRLLYGIPFGFRWYSQYNETGINPERSIVRIAGPYPSKYLDELHSGLQKGNFEMIEKKGLDKIIFFINTVKKGIDYKIEKI